MFLMEEIDKMSYQQPSANLPITRNEILNLMKTHDESSFPR
jgi:hypothetical protein